MAQLEIDVKENLLYFHPDMLLSENGIEVQKILNHYYQVSMVSHSVRLPALQKLFIVLRKQLRIVNALYEKEVAPEGFCYYEIDYLDLKQVISSFALKWKSSLYEKLWLIHKIFCVIFEEVANVISVESYIFYYGH